MGVTSIPGVLSCGPTSVPNILTAELGVGGREWGRQELAAVHREKKKTSKMWQRLLCLWLVIHPFHEAPVIRTCWVSPKNFPRASFLAGGQSPMEG